MYQNVFINAPQISIIGKVFAWWEEIKRHVSETPPDEEQLGKRGGVEFFLWKRHLQLKWKVFLLGT